MAEITAEIIAEYNAANAQFLAQNALSEAQRLALETEFWTEIDELYALSDALYYAFEATNPNFDCYYEM